MSLLRADHQLTKLRVATRSLVSPYDFDLHRPSCVGRGVGWPLCFTRGRGQKARSKMSSRAANRSSELPYHAGEVRTKFIKV